jgi:hypothetical protein
MPRTIMEDYRRVFIRLWCNIGPKRLDTMLCLS